MCVYDINTHFQLFYTDKVDEKQASDGRTLGQRIENTVKKQSTGDSKIFFISHFPFRGNALAWTPKVANSSNFVFPCSYFMSTLSATLNLLASARDF